MKERIAIYSLQFLNAIQNTILGLSMLIGSLMMAYSISREGSKMSVGEYREFLWFNILLFFRRLRTFRHLHRSIEFAVEFPWHDLHLFTKYFSEYGKHV